ncbi:MAG: CapA family protein [Bryobacteraceae bacterium]
MVTRRDLLWLLPSALAVSCRPKPEARPVPPEPSTRLVFGGDVMLSRHVGRLARMRRDPAYPFRDLAPYTSAADIAFLNLESPFSDRGARVEKGMIFKAEPGMVEGLVLAGVDVVSTANNHARDRRSYGLEYTVSWLERHNIAAVGTGRSESAARAGAVLVRNGVRFGFLAYTYDQLNGNYPKTDPRVAMLDADAMREDVAAMARRAGVIIVSMHAGTEYVPKPNSQQVRFAHAAIDAGVDLVIGHHPHVVQPAEIYGHGVIVYSLGNLVFDQFQRKETQQGRLAEAIFKGNRLERVTLLDVDIVKTVPRLAGRSQVVFPAVTVPRGA